MTPMDGSSIPSDVSDFFWHTLTRAGETAAFLSAITFVVFATILFTPPAGICSVCGSAVGSLLALLLVLHRYIPSPLFARTQSGMPSAKLLRYEPILLQHLQRLRSPALLVAASMPMVLFGPITYAYALFRGGQSQEVGCLSIEPLVRMLYVALFSFIPSVSLLIGLQWLAAAHRLRSKRPGH